MYESYKKLSIIIVNYNTKDLISLCIESIYNTFNGCFEIIVVDNNSSDNSVEYIKEKFPAVLILENKENEGFGRANNRGVSVASGEFILLLNSDIIVQKNTIEKCIEKIEDSPDISVLGCKLVNEDGSVQPSCCYYIDEFLRILKSNLFIDKIYKFKEKTDLRAIMGAFMLIKKIDFLELGGFDSDFFMYSEEIDFCDRLKKNKKNLLYFPDVFAIHKNQGSCTNKEKSLKQRCLSHMLMIWKKKTIFGYYFYMLLQIFNTITNFSLLWLLKQPFKNQYKKDFFQNTKIHYSLFGKFLLIPFIYSKKIGDGTKMLKYD